MALSQENNIHYGEFACGKSEITIFSETQILLGDNKSLMDYTFPSQLHIYLD